MSATTYVDTPLPKYTDQARSTVRHLPQHVRSYFSDMFPIMTWLPQYNMLWAWSDLMGGLTVGSVVIPQAMAYAKLVGLPAEYGLYTSFVGVALYPFLGTSKDISIGTTAIQSLFLGQIFASIQETPQYQSGQWTDQKFAVTMAFFAGIITLALGILKLGILYNFICQPAISGFMAGSAVTIVISQIGKIMGIHVNTSQVPYLVFGDTLKGLPETKVDAVFGFLSLVWLYGIKYICQFFSKRYPQHRRGIFYFSMSRNVIVIVVTTFLSWVINHFGQYAESPFTILGPVPAGFQRMGAPELDTSLVAYILPNIPSMVVLLVMEHCSIATSLGKISDYRIDANQEILSIGLANIFGCFFSAYPATGSFCRSAVQNKSGAKTPLVNVLVAIIVVLALYALTPAFQYIPTSSLAAVIAHAVTDLIVGPTVWRRFWNVHPSELLIFACAFIISLFARLDVSIYVAVALSIVIQLYRSARPRYAILGRMDDDTVAATKTMVDEKSAARSELDTLAHCNFVSLSHPILGQHAKPIAPGIVAFQPRDNMIFENSMFVSEKIMDEVKRATRRGKPLAEKVGDRPWNNAGGAEKSDKPLLHAVIMDLTGVNQMDYSAIEDLKAAANQAERYSGRPVSWFFVLNDSLAVRRCLLFGGFGTQERKPGRPFRSDLKKRNGQDDPANDNNDGDDDSSDGQQSINDNNNNKDNHQVTEIEDVSSRPVKNESTLSYNHSDSAALNGSMDRGAAVTHLNDVYPYFFFTMRDAAIAACIRHAVPEEHVSPAPSLSVSVVPNTDEEKKLEKQ
ncbi:sulfate transporter family-domain-containing protein [Zychaea mexicana]|uniref:sulfate transporter family-domain-containing protein n=1 Tax=Zychaea mexicana TaxID=64656 RepID=UPI0022FEE352|nr:sulfate transporter family-domain-containing protein [Zychaea mexicana]KAI9490874.1 sulfate transporter family-domain-containing protein [Zychaea mexicana]